jgi:hypothetical protein
MLSFYEIMVMLQVSLEFFAKNSKENSESNLKYNDNMQV